MFQRLLTTFNAMNPRDRRAVGFGVIAAAGIMVYVFLLLPLIENWSGVRAELKTYRDRLADVSAAGAGDQARIAGLYKAVPFLEMPQTEDVQRKLFWDRSYDQLKSSGIQLTSGPSYESTSRTKSAAGFRTLRLTFAGTCKYEQAVKYLAALNENPYLVSIEQFTVKTNEKKSDQVDIAITLSTFVQ